MTNPGTFLKVDLTSWVFGTIKKVQEGTDWNDAWQKTYRELGGKSEKSGKKGCPMNGTKTLYLLGRIKGSNMPYKNPPAREVWDSYSKNGVYALLAVGILSHNPSISLNELWPRIQERVREELGEEPALSNQGGPTVAHYIGKTVRQPRVGICVPTVTTGSSENQCEVYNRNDYFPCTLRRRRDLWDDPVFSGWQFSDYVYLYGYFRRGDVLFSTKKRGDRGTFSRVLILREKHRRRVFMPDRFTELRDRLIRPKNADA